MDPFYSPKPIKELAEPSEWVGYLSSEAFSGHITGLEISQYEPRTPDLLINGSILSKFAAKQTWDTEETRLIFLSSEKKVLSHSTGHTKFLPNRNLNLVTDRVTLLNKENKTDGLGDITTFLDDGDKPESVVVYKPEFPASRDIAGYYFLTGVLDKNGKKQEVLLYVWLISIINTVEHVFVPIEALGESSDIVLSMPAPLLVKSRDMPSSDQYSYRLLRRNIPFHQTRKTSFKAFKRNLRSYLFDNVKDGVPNCPSSCKSEKLSIQQDSPKDNEEVIQLLLSRLELRPMNNNKKVALIGRIQELNQQVLIKSWQDLLLLFNATDREKELISRLFIEYSDRYPYVIADKVRTEENYALYKELIESGSSAINNFTDLIDPIPFHEFKWLTPTKSQDTGMPCYAFALAQQSPNSIADSGVYTFQRCILDGKKQWETVSVFDVSVMDSNDETLSTYKSNSLFSSKPLVLDSTYYLKTLKERWNLEPLDAGVVWDDYNVTVSSSIITGGLERAVFDDADTGVISAVANSKNEKYADIILEGLKSTETLNQNTDSNSVALTANLNVAVRNKGSNSFVRTINNVNPSTSGIYIARTLTKNVASNTSEVKTVVVAPIGQNSAEQSLSKSWRNEQIALNKVSYKKFGLFQQHMGEFMTTQKQLQQKYAQEISELLNNNLSDVPLIQVDINNNTHLVYLNEDLHTANKFKRFVQFLLNFPTEDQINSNVQKLLKYGQKHYYTNMEELVTFWYNKVLFVAQFSRAIEVYRAIIHEMETIQKTDSKNTQVLMKLESKIKNLEETNIRLHKEIGMLEDQLKVCKTASQWPQGVKYGSISQLIGTHLNLSQELEGKGLTFLKFIGMSVEESKRKMEEFGETVATFENSLNNLEQFYKNDIFKKLIPRLVKLVASQNNITIPKNIVTNVSNLIRSTVSTGLVNILQNPSENVYDDLENLRIELNKSILKTFLTNQITDQEFINSFISQLWTAIQLPGLLFYRYSKDVTLKDYKDLLRDFETNVNDLEEGKKDKERLRSEMARQATELVRLKNIVDDLETIEKQFETQTDELSEVRTKNEQLQRRNAELQDQLSRALAEEQNQREMIRQKESEIGDLKVKISDYDAEIVELEAKISSSSGRVGDLEDGVSDFQSQLNNLRETKSQLESSLLESRHKETSLNNEIAELKQKISDLNTKIQSEKATYNDQLLQLTEQVKVANANSDQFSSSEINELRQQLKDKQEDLRVFHDQIKKQSSDYTVLMQTYNTEMQLRNTIQQEKQELEAEIQRVQAQTQITLTDLQRAIDEINRQNQIKDALEREVDEKMETIDSLKNKKKGLKNDKRELEEKVVALSNENIFMKALYEDDHAALEQAQNSNNQLKEEVQKLKKLLQDSKQELKKMQTVQMTPANLILVEELEDRVRELSVQYNEAVRHQKEAISQAQQLDEVNKQLWSELDVKDQEIENLRQKIKQLERICSKAAPINQSFVGKGIFGKQGEIAARELEDFFTTLSQIRPDSFNDIIADTIERSYFKGFRPSNIAAVFIVTVNVDPIVVPTTVENDVVLDASLFLPKEIVASIKRDDGNYSIQWTGPSLGVETSNGLTLQVYADNASTQSGIYYASIFKAYTEEHKEFLLTQPIGADSNDNPGVPPNPFDPNDQVIFDNFDENEESDDENIEIFDPEPEPQPQVVAVSESTVLDKRSWYCDITFELKIEVPAKNRSRRLLLEELFREYMTDKEAISKFYPRTTRYVESLKHSNIIQWIQSQMTESEAEFILQMVKRDEQVASNTIDHRSVPTLPEYEDDVIQMVFSELSKQTDSLEQRERGIIPLRFRSTSDFIRRILLDSPVFDLDASNDNWIPNQYLYNSLDEFKTDLEKIGGVSSILKRIVNDMLEANKVDIDFVYKPQYKNTEFMDYVLASNIIQDFATSRGTRVEQIPLSEIINELATNPESSANDRVVADKIRRRMDYWCRYVVRGQNFRSIKFNELLKLFKNDVSRTVSQYQKLVTYQILKLEISWFLDSIVTDPAFLSSSVKLISMLKTFFIVPLQVKPQPFVLIPGSNPNV